MKLSNPHAKLRAGLVTITILAVSAGAAAPGWAQDEVEDLLSNLQRMWKGGEERPDTLVARELPAVAAAAGLAARGPVAAGVLDRAGAAEHIAQVMAAQLPPARLAALERAYHALGLLDRQVGLGDAIRDLYAGQAGGFYDPVGRKLHLLSDLPAVLQVPVIRHELVHALQDQHFGLARWVEAASADEDRALAVQALLEGHATDVMNRMSLASLWGAGEDALPPAVAQAELAEALDGLDMAPARAGSGAGGGLDVAALSLPTGTPPVLSAQLLFPYVVGATFVADYRRRHPEDPACAGLYARPPGSTAEVLEPGLWERGFRPSLSESGTAVPGQELWLSTALGRLNIAVLLTGQGDPAAGLPAAGQLLDGQPDSIAVVGGGWRGDRVVVVGATHPNTGTIVPDSLSVMWVSEWDDSARAETVARLLVARVRGLSIRVDRARVEVVVAAEGYDVGVLHAALSRW